MIDDNKKVISLGFAIGVAFAVWSGIIIVFSGIFYALVMGVLVIASRI